jgi:hypothetical protein
MAKYARKRLFEEDRRERSRDMPRENFCRIFLNAENEPFIVTNFHSEPRI